jgi:hypothetical protein
MFQITLSNIERWKRVFNLRCHRGQRLLEVGLVLAQALPTHIVSQNQYGRIHYNLTVDYPPENEVISSNVQNVGLEVKANICRKIQRGLFSVALF